MWMSKATFIPVVGCCLSSKHSSVGGFRLSKRPVGANRLFMSKPSTGGVADEVASTKALKVLALHGSEGNRLEFTKRLQPLREAAARRFPKVLRLEIDAIDAPFPKTSNGFAWWSYEPGERSSTAKEYYGFEESANLVCDTLLGQGATGSQPQQPAYDVVLAHSQGAILLSALFALDRLPTRSTVFILNGVAWPNPFAQQIRTVQLQEKLPRILFVMGEKDRINPMDTAEQVREALEEAGCDVTVYKHPGGHSVPTDEASLKAMLDFIGSSSK